MGFDIIESETKGCFDFFWNEANTDKNSPGFGLIRDKSAKGAEKIASIASVGFGLSAIIIGVERGYITTGEARQRTLGTLNTFLNNAEQEHGFFYHFLNLETAKKYEEFFDCASIIDTSILLNGMITAAEYFGGDISHIFEEIYARVNWQKYYDEANNLFYMGYRAESGGFGAWDMYAEQLMQYILGTASPSFPVPANIYKGFNRDLVKYKDIAFYHSPGGSLFTHQFSHAWYDFKGKKDSDGIDWFENSVKASVAAKQYCIDNPQNFKTFKQGAWGLTACEGPNGYRGYGAPPFHPNCDAHINDGTMAPAGAVGSIIFTPDEAIAAMEHYRSIPGLWGKYGFTDAYNIDLNWVCDFEIGIDKGISILMPENYRTGLIQQLYMQNSYVKKAEKELGWLN